MEPRISFPKVTPRGFQAMLDLSNQLRNSGFEESLLNLTCLRASQINGCAYCIDMHWKDLRAAGEGEQRLYGPTPGKSLLTTQTVSGLRWPGQKR